MSLTVSKTVFWLSGGFCSGNDPRVSFCLSVSLIPRISQAVLVPVILGLSIALVIFKSFACRGKIEKRNSRVQASCLCKSVLMMF